MATAEEAKQAIIDRIKQQAPGASAEQLKNFAEALAWVTNANQPH
jgi:hypothetical protein